MSEGRPTGAPVLELVPAPGVQTWAVDPGMALYVPSPGELLVLNTAAAYAWTALADGLGIEAMAAELAQARNARPGDAEAEVRDLLEDLAERGALVGPDARTERVPASPRQGRQPALGAPYLRWNSDRVYRVAGRSVVVRVPSETIGTWVDLGLPGARVEDPGSVDAAVEVARGELGWTVAGTHYPAAVSPSDHQLVSVVREAVLLSAARAADGVVLRGSALECDREVSLVLGEAEDRTRLVEAWRAADCACHADEVLAATSAGGVLPGRVGIGRRPAYQFVDGEPGPVGSPLVTLDGDFVEYWKAGPARSSDETLPARSIVVVANTAGDPASTPLTPASALQALLAHRVANQDVVAEDEAAALIALAMAVPALQIGGEPAEAVALVAQEIA